ncbi:hypothetical protein [Candidatus Magnetomonas plexicatena]|uniref:hypothetical protein n=1 Tax=Candidatus Magnetomonas plexicatena TaxID=2552947 RepID=UPI001C796A34|nr:hypothetical protein E2O03_010780 [Nitrospirales bacterium LBB_01]
MSILKEKLLAIKTNVETRKMTSKEKKEEWINRINNLFTQISEWLKPMQDEQLLSITKTKIKIHEQLLGIYTVETMVVTFLNNETIEIIPIGRYVLGGNGRLDIKKGLNVIMIIGNDDGSWKFVQRDRFGKRVGSDFNKDNFEKFLSELIDEY